MIALFDMDGTLFAGDSQLRFARWMLHRHGWRRLYLLLVLPCGLLRTCGIINTCSMKRAFLSYAWGMKEKTLQQECTQFVEQELIPSLFPEILERLQAHQQAGDTTVLCSASPTWWTSILGAKLGFTHTIGTPVESHPRVRLFPRIPPPGNNKGENKLERLAAVAITRADVGYTDSKADLPMLSICRQTVLVSPSSQLETALPEADIIRPQITIRKISFTLRCLLGW